MDVPVDLPLFGELVVLDGEEDVGDPWRKENIDKCVAKERSQNFVDMERECREAGPVGERLYCVTEPWDWRDGEWVVHCGKEVAIEELGVEKRAALYQRYTLQRGVTRNVRIVSEICRQIVAWFLNRTNAAPALGTWFRFQGYSMFTFDDALDTLTK